MRRLRLGYPFLFAVLPVLSILTRNPGGWRLADAGVVIGALLLGCAVLYLLVATVVRGGWSSPVVPLVVLAVILWGNAKSTLGGWTRQVGGGPAAVAVVAVLLALTVIAVWWLARRPRYLEQVSTFLTLTGFIMVAWLGFRITSDLIHARSAIRHSPLVKELARPVRSRPATPASSAAAPRDIYLIVLDEYANSSVLEERYRFNNRVFEDSLRRLGFTIPRTVHSNYAQTLLSLPSLLNFSHLTQLAAELGTRSTDASLPNYLLENNRAVAFLKSRGYQFLFFPSRWWPSTDHNPNADWEFDAWSGIDLGYEATRSDLRRSFIRATALGLLLAVDAWDAEHLKRTLAGLEQVPERAEPTFAFAHILSPHWPYVLNVDCKAVTGGRLRPSNRDQRYIDQLQCLNRMLLKLVTGLLQRSSVPPIILLQGDHGSNQLGYSSAQSVQTVSPAQARERFGAFGAYYVPEGGDRLFGDTVTVVNVFAKVLGHYFGAAVPPVPNKLYMSTERTPYTFVEFDATSLTPVRLSQSASP